MELPAPPSPSVRNPEMYSFVSHQATVYITAFFDGLHDLDCSMLDYKRETKFTKRQELSNKITLVFLSVCLSYQSAIPISMPISQQYPSVCLSVSNTHQYAYQSAVYTLFAIFSKIFNMDTLASIELVYCYLWRGCHRTITEVIKTIIWCLEECPL